LEVLLTSNEFILPQSVGDRHSFPLYFAAGVSVSMPVDNLESRMNCSHLQLHSAV
jgi:hypothetical protein